MLRELRIAVRRLARTPGFTLVVVLTLALGIGANSAVFSIVNGVLLRPLPYPEPDRLVSVTHFYPSLDGLEPGFAAPTYRDVSEQARSFSSIGVSAGWQPNLTGEGDPERLNGATVSGHYFTTYGIAPQIGRTILPADVGGDPAPIVVLSHGLWSRVFGEDPSVIGRTLLLSGRSYEIVGVMPPDFRDMLRPDAQIWAPLGFSSQQLAARTNEFTLMTGRMLPGVSVEQARLEMTALAEQLKEQNPGSYPADWTLRLHTLNDLGSGGMRPALLLLLGAVGLVLLIACANVANLLLTRASARRKEMAIRGALGAGRTDLVRQLLTEGVLLALAGATLGLLMAAGAISLLHAINPANLPRIEEIGIDRGVLLYTLALALATGVLFGLAPAFRLGRLDLQSTLRAAGRGAGGDGGGQTLRRGLVVGQVAIALTLLIGAGLLIRSFAALQEVDPGFAPDRVAVFTLAIPVARYDTQEARVAFHREVSERIASIPGVQSVGTTSLAPFAGGMSTRSFGIEGMMPADGEPSPWGDDRVVSPGFHRTLQIPLLRGRYFTEADRQDAPLVAIVDEEMVRRYWPDRDPIGQRLAITLNEEGEPNWMEVVGVVGHTLMDGLDGDRRVQMYRPHAQAGWGSMMYVVRTRGEPVQVIPAVRAEVAAVDRDQPLSQIGTLRSLVNDAAGARRLSTGLLGLFAALALILASIGIYGVISFDVNRRAQEMGVRMALGAETPSILRLVMGRAMGLTALGIVIGLFGALALTRVISGQLYGIGSTDPLTFATVPLLLGAVALLACYLPARRATRVDPVVALRNE